MEAAFNFQTVHEIVGYGHIRRAGKNQLLQIELLLRDLGDDGKLKDIRSVFSNWSKPISVWIEAGKLDLVPIGSRWLLGKRLKRCKTKLYFRDVPVEMLGFSCLGDMLKVAETTFSAMPYYKLQWKYQIENKDHLGDKPLSTAPETTASETTERETILFVPVLEMLRALFGVSSHFLLRMMKGINSPALAPQSAIFDRTRSRIDKKGIVTLFCSRRLSQYEALIAAASLFNDEVLKAYQAITKFVQIDLHGGGMALLKEMPFPFQTQDLLLTFQGEKIEGVDKNSNQLVRMNVATKILKLSFTFQFTRIEIFIDRPKRDPQTQSANSAMKTAGTSDYEFQNIEAPDPGWRPVRVKTNGGATINPKNEVEILILPNNKPGVASARVIVDTTSQIQKLSTEDERSGQAMRVGSLYLVRDKRLMTKSESDQLDADSVADTKLDVTRLAIVQIANENGWLVASEECRALPNSKLKVFLITLNCAVPGVPGVLKPILIVELDRDERSLAVFRHADPRPFNEVDLRQIIIFIKAERGHVTGKLLNGFLIETVRHITMNKIDGFAEVLKETILSLLTR